MRISRAIPLLFAALAFIACGKSDDKKTNQFDAAPMGGNPDAPTIGTPDAPMASGVNALDQICDQVTACPTGNACTGISGLGSADKGWCTPDCTAGKDTTCTTGYKGPAGGVPKCALVAQGSQTPSGCIVICKDDTQCASGMKCQALPAPNDKIKACAPPP